jgi:LysM repeat protein
MRHRVERGESLYRIGKAYGVSPETLARVNGLRTRAGSRSGS